MAESSRSIEVSYLMDLRLTHLATIIVLILSALVLPTVARAQVSESTLANGLRLIVAESHDVPIVSVDVWVRAGSRRQKPDQPAVAHFLEHLLFKGTASHPNEESIDGTIEDLGGSIDAATSWDWAHFYTEVPSSGCDAASALLADVLQNTILTTDLVESERPIIAAEIERSENSPEQNLAAVARSLMYTDNSAYAKPITGSEDDVKKVSLSELSTFYKTYYVPNNTTVVISGDVTTAAAQQIVEQYFGTWKEGDSLPLNSGDGESTYRKTTGPSVVEKRLIQTDADQSYMVMAFPAPSVADTPDAWDMDVLMTLLGQGANSRLTTDLKIKKHLVTAIQTDYLTQRDPGMLTISASMPTSNTSLVQSGIIDQINQLRNTAVGDIELNAAKLALKSSYLFDVDTDSGHADSLGFYDCIGSYEYDVNYVDHVNTVTADEIQKTAQKYLDTNSYTLVMQVPPTDPITAESQSATPLRLVSGRSGK